MRNRTTAGAIGLALLLVALVIGGVLAARGGTSDTPTPISGTAAVANPAVPERVWETLREIDDGTWPESANAPGTKGGQTWRNRDGDLPRTDAAGNVVRYQEWDVNPKQQGRSRDAERIVTGSDGSAWYTGDHYETFERMR